MSNIKQIDMLLELERNPSTNQRSLSQKLNISLGLTNEILQNLIHRGWVKASKLKGRKWLYLITPAGMSKATQFAYQRFQETQKYFWDAENIIISLLESLYKKGKEKLIILGKNQYTKLIILASTDSPIELTMIISDKQSQKNFLGHQVVSINEFTKIIKQAPEEYQDTIIISVDRELRKSILSKISQNTNDVINSNEESSIDIINIDELIKKYITSQHNNVA
ncbi:MAG: winged helix-turn-helix transcriptional regulator, partial [Atribacterota bacterium]|nr:winged helix-turn-helix transcriptional regulator [Atribacterota bacterium]